MPRFFFELHGTTSIQDVEGEVHPTFDHAARHAQRVARELARNSGGTEGHSIVVLDSKRRELLEIPLNGARDAAGSAGDRPARASSYSSHSAPGWR
jgi:hypothetical protein